MIITSDLNSEVADIIEFNDIDEIKKKIKSYKKSEYNLGQLKNVDKMSIQEATDLFAEFLKGCDACDKIKDHLPFLRAFAGGKNTTKLKKLLKYPLKYKDCIQLFDSLYIQAESRKSEAFTEIGCFESAGYDVNQLKKEIELNRSGVLQKIKRAHADYEKMEVLKSRFNSFDHNSYPEKAVQIKALFLDFKNYKRLFVLIGDFEKEILSSRLEISSRMRKLVEKGWDTSRLGLVEDLDITTVKSWLTEFEDFAAESETILSDLEGIDFSDDSDLLVELQESLKDPYNVQQVKRRLQAHVEGIDSEKQEYVTSFQKMGEEFTGQRLSDVSRYQIKKLKILFNECNAAYKEAESIKFDLENLDLSIFPESKEKIETSLQNIKSLGSASAEISIAKARVQAFVQSYDDEISDAQARGISAYLLIEAAEKNLEARREASNTFKKNLALAEDISKKLKEMDCSLFLEEASAVKTLLSRPEDAHIARAAFDDLVIRVEHEKDLIEKGLDELSKKGFKTKALAQKISSHDLFYVKNKIDTIKSDIEELDLIRERLENYNSDEFCKECQLISTLADDPERISQALDRFKVLEERASLKRESLLSSFSDFSEAGLIIDYIELSNLSLVALEKKETEYIRLNAMAADARVRLEGLDTSCHIHTAVKITELLKRPDDIKSGIISLDRLEKKIESEKKVMLDTVFDLEKSGLRTEELKRTIFEEHAIDARAAISDFLIRARGIDELKKEIKKIDKRVFPKEYQELQYLSTMPSKYEEIRKFLRDVRVREEARAAEIRYNLSSYQKQGYIFPDKNDFNNEESLFELQNIEERIDGLVNKSRVLLKRLEKLDTSLFEEERISIEKLALNLPELNKARKEIVRFESFIRAERRKLVNQVSAFRRDGYIVTSIDIDSDLKTLLTCLDDFQMKTALLKELKERLECLDTSLFSERRIALLKLLKDPAGLEQAEKDFSVLAADVSAARNAIEERYLSLNEKGFTLPDMDEIMSSRLASAISRISRFESMAGEAEKLLAELEKKDTFFFTEKTAEIEVMARDLPNLDKASRELKRLDGLIEEKTLSLKKKCLEWQKKGLSVDSILELFNHNADHMRINEAVSGFERNLDRIIFLTRKFNNLKNSAFKVECKRIEGLLGEPLKVDEAEILVTALEDKIGEAFAQLSSLVGDYMSRGYEVTSLEKSLTGDLDSALKVFKKFEKNRIAIDKLKTEFNLMDTSLFKDHEYMAELFKKPHKIGEAEAKIQAIKSENKKAEAGLTALFEIWKRAGYIIPNLKNRLFLNIYEKKKVYADYSDRITELDQLNDRLDDLSGDLDEKVLNRARHALKAPDNIKIARTLVLRLVKFVEINRNKIKRADELVNMLESLDTSIFTQSRSEIYELIRQKGDLARAESSITGLVKKISKELVEFDAYVSDMASNGFDVTRLRRLREDGESLEDLRKHREIYESDIKHLQCVAQSLDTMDTSLFIPQVQLIKSKLNSPDLLDEVEANIRNLTELILNKRDEFNKYIEEFKQEGFDTSKLDEPGLEQALFQTRLQQYTAKAGHLRALRHEARSLDLTAFARDAAVLSEMLSDPYRHEEAEEFIKLLGSRMEALDENLSARLEKVLESGLLIDLSEFGKMSLLDKSNQLDIIESSASRLKDLSEKFDTLPLEIIGGDYRELKPFFRDPKALDALTAAWEYFESCFKVRVEAMKRVVEKYESEGYVTTELKRIMHEDPGYFDDYLNSYEMNVGNLMRLNVKLRSIDRAYNFGKIKGRDDDLLFNPDKLAEARDYCEKAELNFRINMIERASVIEKYRDRGLTVREKTLQHLLGISDYRDFDETFETLKERLDKSLLSIERIQNLDVGSKYEAFKRSVLKMYRDETRLEEAGKAEAELMSSIEEYSLDLVQRIELFREQGYTFTVESSLHELEPFKLEKLLLDIENREKRMLMLMAKASRYSLIDPFVKKVELLVKKSKDLDNIEAFEKGFAALEKDVKKYFKKEADRLQKKGFVVDYLRESMSEPVDVVNRVFNRFISKVELCEILEKDLLALDTVCYEDQVFEIQEIIKNPLLYDAALQKFRILEKSILEEDEQFEFEMHWFIKRGFQVELLKKAVSDSRIARRGIIQEFRGKVARAEKYSLLMAEVSLVFKNSDFVDFTDLLKDPMHIIKFEKKLPELNDRLLDMARGRLKEWSDYSFVWGSLLDIDKKGIEHFIRDFKEYEAAAEKCIEYIDAARTSRVLSNHPAYKALALTLRNPLVIDSVKTELDNLFASQDIQIKSWSGEEG